MNIYKKIILLLACISTIFAMSYIFEVYAKYATSASGNANIPIAKWNISVNNLSVKNNSNISAVISPFFPGNDNIASNIIAPTAEGYFDLMFDFSKVDVSFDYSILISPNIDSSVQDLLAIKYTIDGGVEQNFDVGTQLIERTY